MIHFFIKLPIELNEIIFLMTNEYGLNYKLGFHRNCRIIQSNINYDKILLSKIKYKIDLVESDAKYTNTFLKKCLKYKHRDGVKLWIDINHHYYRFDDSFTRIVTSGDIDLLTYFRCKSISKHLHFVNKATLNYLCKMGFLKMLIIVCTLYRHDDLTLEHIKIANKYNRKNVSKYILQQHPHLQNFTKRPLMYLSFNGYKPRIDIFAKGLLVATDSYDAETGLLKMNEDLPSYKFKILK